MCDEYKQKIADMLAAAPEPVSELCLKQWKYVGALTIDEIKAKGDKGVKFDIAETLLKTFPAKKPHTGQGCMTHDYKHGICRCITAIGGMFEG